MIRIKQPIGSNRQTILGIVGVVALGCLYCLVSYRQHVRNPDDTTIPNIHQLIDGFVVATTPKENSLKALFGTEEKKSDNVFHKLWASAEKTMLFRDAKATYERLAKGLFMGCVLSIILGTWMGCYESLASLFVPMLAFLAKVPGTAMLAVFFVVVGTGETMFGTMIGFGVLPTLTQAIYLSARDDLHHEEIDKAYTLGGSNYELIWNVVFPQILPKIVESIRLQIGPAMVYLIAAEMLVGQVGMGYQIRMQQRLLHMNLVYDYILILGLTGLATDKLMVFLRTWLCPWYDKR